MNSTAKPKVDEVDEIEVADEVLEKTEAEPDELSLLEAKIVLLESEVRTAREQERRAQADYQNLQRRTIEDRSKMAKLASREVIESILMPLDHLYLAKEQLKDKGLEMVWQQFQRVLAEQGLEQLNVKAGDEIDTETMEVIGYKDGETAKNLKVAEVKELGYQLNGVIIKLAKVLVGTDKK